MPHLDEGLLHTYLDDALPDDVELHLRECAECRANLENARLLKSRADTILARVAPVGIAMPSFEELQARAKSRSGDSEAEGSKQAGGQQRSFYQLRSLAWAATVVLAVAVGWYARSTVLQTGQSRFASEGETRGRLTIPLPETEGANSNAPNEGAPASMSGVEQEETSPGAELDEVVVGQVTPDVVGGVAIATDREETLEARRVSTPEPTEPPAHALEAPEVSAAPLPVARIGSSGVTAAGEGGRTRRAISSVPQLSQQVAAERTAAEPTVTLAAGGRGERSEVVWTSVDAATAGSFLDGPVPTVEGLPVVGYATSSLDGNQAIRILQRLESGQLLELVITPEDDAGFASDAKKGMEFLDAAPGAAAESLNTVAVARGNLRIRLSAVLATDSLRVLGQNIPSGR